MTKIYQVLSYLQNHPDPICDDCLAIQAHLPTRQDANRICRTLAKRQQILRDYYICKECNNTKLINQTLSEEVGVLKIQSTIPIQDESQFIISEIRYSWEPVLLDGIKPYLFPNDPTNYMKYHYKTSAIYRWCIKFDEGKVIHYIGEADELCPRRINQYIKPGLRQQTNQRLNAKFHEYLKDGCHIGLDIF